MRDTMTERVPQATAGRSPEEAEDCLKHPAWCPASPRVQVERLEAGAARANYKLQTLDLLDQPAAAAVGEGQPQPGPVDVRLGGAGAAPGLVGEDDDGGAVGGGVGDAGGVDLAGGDDLVLRDERLEVLARLGEVRPEGAGGVADDHAEVLVDVVVVVGE